MDMEELGREVRSRRDDARENFEENFRLLSIF